MDENVLKNMAHLTYGIYVLTTRFEGMVNGMIASWVSQVSYAPPLILVAVHPNRFSHELLHKSGQYALHILARDQKDLLGRFKGPDPRQKFKSLEWKDGVTGCPVLADCIGYLECRIVQHVMPGNHSLFIGEVVSAGFNAEAAPLCTLDYDGCYMGNR
jgi:flavin reductase (DIM6/NTAB) family NADH-FMN oxidoreductase RutF